MKKTSCVLAAAAAMIAALMLAAADAASSANHTGQSASVGITVNPDQPVGGQSWSFTLSSLTDGQQYGVSVFENGTNVWFTFLTYSGTDTVTFTDPVALTAGAVYEVRVEQMAHNRTVTRGSLSFTAA